MGTALWACSANAMARPKSLTISRVAKAPWYPRDAVAFSPSPRARKVAQAQLLPELCP